MEFRIVDTEVLLKNFKPYHESMERINEEKKKFSDKVDLIRTEMEGIAKSSSLILDNNTKEQKVKRFEELREQGYELETEFRQMISKLQNEELDQNFNQVSGIIEEWASQNNIGHVFNKLQLAYTDNSADCTLDVIEVIKSKNLYKEFKEDLNFQLA
jgi:Skp family chaperone for outer membrane proteins